MKNQKGIASIIFVIIIVVLLAAAGFFVYQYFSTQNTNNQSQGQNQQKIANQADVRSCITDSVAQSLDATFLTGKSFTFFCASGEWGTFEKNGKIVVSEGVSQGSAPINPINARWEIKNGSLLIYNSANNQLVHNSNNFKFFNFSGDIFAMSEGVGCDSMIIGPSVDKNGQFYQNKVMVEECQ